ncbi:DOMON domain-containing protein [Danaus plexippus plexippus]|uniref:DOMON domain-containing protein n=1 Tax=Danaus plexippus plexippus TaxID=278856 RepID=A0A212EJ63_DANPL|nr:DOMON domain-containing protein [Danaus plexippus plexippus]
MTSANRNASKYNNTVQTNRTTPSPTASSPSTLQSKLNCEVLFDELAFEVRWAIAGSSVVLQLVAKLEDGEYMSFGLSGDPEHSVMIGGDVAVAWVDKETLKGYSDDYYLEGKSQCAGGRGSCPDTSIRENRSSIRLLNAALVNGYSIVTYQRPLKASDELDLPVYTNISQPIIWAIGPLNSKTQVSYHQHFTKGDRFIEFGRPPLWNCPMPEGEEDMRLSGEDSTGPSEEEHKVVIRPNPVPTPKPTSKVIPWDIPGIQCYEPPDGIFYAQMGPTGGKQGYSAITGHVGWGISWYINGLLIPEINVVRGKKYTFVVEGGNNPDIPARYHPFYITNDPVGGYHHKTPEEKQGIEIYAGTRRARNGELLPTGTGRLCNWTPDNNGPEADEYPSFGAYQRSLTLVCEEGNPGVVTWVPDENTPDTVYYQCFTHRYLGWKINVVDDCDETEVAESRVVESVILPSDLMGVESIQVQSRVKPEKNFLSQRTKIEKIINMKNNYNDFSSNKGESSLSGELFSEQHRNLLHPSGHEYELPITNIQIKEVIEAVESIEDQMKDELKRNNTLPQTIPQYQVHEDVKELFVPEQPMRDGDEYVVDMGKLPETFMLPPNQKPQTLHNVLRPNAPSKHVGNMRPPFRRPVPPEIKLRRPYPIYPKGNNQYPLPIPNPHGMNKKPGKYSNNRPSSHMHHRPSQSNIPPMKAMPPLHSRKPDFNQGPPKYIQKIPNILKQNNMMNLPSSNIGQLQSQTLSLGHTDIIANQVVKSQITLPGSNDAVAQQSAQQTFFDKPGQIILGKPMDHPQPLDQQITQEKPEFVQPLRVSVSSTKIKSQNPEAHMKSTIRPNINNNIRPQIRNEIKSSDFIGQSTDTSTIAPAINTGFKPDSIVIESGFKPIIREPLMASEDKIADYDGVHADRREDTDIEEDYQESPQYINTEHAYPSEKLTETFEPMFIPSPPDHLLGGNERTKEVFPSNHAKEDRPHPVYVKTESELNALFGKKNMEKDIPADMLMESDKLSPQYLPPEPKHPKEHLQKISSEQTFTTYDGKTVSADTLTSIPEENKLHAKIFSSKLLANSEFLLKTPQFGPFRGQIPPAVAGHIDKNVMNLSRPVLTDSASTQLKLVNAIRKTSASELVAEQDEKLNDDSVEDEEYELEDEDENKRSRRETKTAQFESGSIEEAMTLKGDDTQDINHMDFEFATPRARASASKIDIWSALPMIAVLFKLF